MKKIIIATIIGLTASGVAFATNQEIKYGNQEQRDDQLYGYNKPAASPSQPAENVGRFKNQEQREDQLHGYSKVKSSESEPAENVGRFKNQEQRADVLYGYDK